MAACSSLGNHMCVSAGLCVFMYLCFYIYVDVCVLSPGLSRIAYICVFLYLCLYAGACVLCPAPPHVWRQLKEATSALPQPCSNLMTHIWYHLITYFTFYIYHFTFYICAWWWWWFWLVYNWRYHLIVVVILPMLMIWRWNEDQDDDRNAEDRDDDDGRADFKEPKWWYEGEMMMMT